jgi:hypothetical protein
MRRDGSSWRYREYGNFARVNAMFRSIRQPTGTCGHLVLTKQTAFSSVCAGYFLFELNQDKWPMRRIHAARMNGT